MSAVRVLKPSVEDIKERDLQKAIEADLEILEEGLQYVDSEVHIGTGRIDTLALDGAGCPTFVEYKRPAGFDRDALIQLMDYVSWFTRDNTHFSYLREHIFAKLRGKTGERVEVKPEVRIILVVSDVEERVKNACFALNCPVKIFTYSLSKLENGDIAVIPKQVFDTAESDTIQTWPPPTEDGIVMQPFKRVYGELKAYLQSIPGVEVYPTRVDMRARSSQVFALMIFRKKEMILRLRVGRGSIEDPRFRLDQREDSDAGNVRINLSDVIGDQIKGWLNS